MDLAPFATVDRQTLAELRAENATLQSRLGESEARIQSLNTQLDWLKRQLFGAKSEKRLVIDPALQPDLLTGLGKADPPAPFPATEKIAYERRKQRRDNTVTDSGLRFDEDVPVETVELGPAPELADVPEDDWVVITEKVSYRLAQRPGSYVILKYVRPVVKRKDTGELVVTPAPANVLDKSVADVSFLAGMLVDKFVYHLPLYRQHQRLRQSGIELSRTSLTNLTGRAIDLVTPIFDGQFRHVLQSRVLAMDETPIKAGRERRGKMRQGWLWPIYGDADEIAFHYTPSRAGDHVREILGEDFQGVLVSDGYQAYARYAARRETVTHAECWAHTRRGYERAQAAEPEAAGEALAIIGSLYRVEEQIRNQGLSGEAKLAYRTEHSEPVVGAFWQWCEGQCRRHDLLPSNPLTKALKYAMARVDALQVFLGDPDVPIDTNHLESALRPIPLGRRNWLFCWTEIGARRVGIIQSLLVTCRLHGINPYTYLVDVLQRIGQHPAKDVLALTPRLWKERFADRPLRSVLDRHDR